MSYPPSRPRRLRLAITAVVIVAALAASGTALALLGHHRARAVTAADRPDHASRSARAQGNTAPPPSAAGMSQSPGQPLVTAADLAGLRRTDFYGVELPASPSAGPMHERGGLAWGFADTPLGALLAAVNIGVRANAQWGPGIFTPTVRRQVTGPGTAALLAGCQAAYQSERLAAGVRAGEPLGRAYVSEEAFRWVVYSPAAATVDIVSAGPGSQGATVRAVTQIEVTWSGGDWQVIAPVSGEWGNSAAPLTALRGYTAFPIPNA